MSAINQPVTEPIQNNEDRQIHQPNMAATPDGADDLDMKQTSDSTSTDRQQQVNETLVDLEMRISALERYAVNNEQQVNAIRSLQSTCMATVVNLQNDFLGFSQRNSVLEAKLNAFLGETQVVNQRVDQLLGESVAFNHRLGSIESQSVALVAESFGFSEKLDQLLRELSAFDFRLTAIEESNPGSSFHSTISAAQFASLNDQCRQFAANLQDLQQQFALNLQNQQQQFAGNQQDQLQVFCQRLESFDERVRCLSDRVQGFEQGLTTVAAQQTKFANADQVSSKFANTDHASSEKFLACLSRSMILVEKFLQLSLRIKFWIKSFPEFWHSCNLLTKNL
jgi:hypothetical protein